MEYSILCWDWSIDTLYLSSWTAVRSLIGWSPFSRDCCKGTASACTVLFVRREREGIQNNSSTYAGYWWLTLKSSTRSIRQRRQRISSLLRRWVRGESACVHDYWRECSRVWVDLFAAACSARAPWQCLSRFFIAQIANVYLQTSVNALTVCVCGSWY